MKTCSYCGRENDDNATQCRECGMALGSSPNAGEPIIPEESLERAGVLDNETQAGLLDAVLTDRGIPHIMQSYHDSAFDGVFQTQKGWGIVLAPRSFREEVRSALEAIKHPPEP